MRKVLNRKLVIIAIAIVLVLIVIGGGAYFVFSGKSTTKTESDGRPEAVSQTPTSPSSGEQLSEQPNKAKYSEYLSDIYLGKMAIGKIIGTDGFPTRTNMFAAGTDLFCSMMTLKKTISSGNVAIAIYDVVTKQDNQPKTVFPMELKAGGSGGCSNLTQSTGKYEYKLYIDDILAAVLPFEVK